MENRVNPTPRSERLTALHEAIARLREIPIEATALTGPVWYGQGWQDAITELEEIADGEDRQEELRPDVAVRPVRYEVSVLSEDDVNYRAYLIEVEDRGQGRWAVTRPHECLGADGTWADGIKPYDRGDAWLDAHRFDLATALRLARAAAPHVSVNGITAAEARARTAGAEEPRK